MLNTITEINFYLFSTISIDLLFKLKLAVMLSIKKYLDLKLFRLVL